MRRSITIVPIAIFMLSLFSCGKKVHIKDEILEVFANVYEEGDILIFQNISTKQTDTSTITKVEVYHDDYDWFRHDGYQPHQAKVWYKNKRLKYGEANQGVLIEAEKRKPDDANIYSISYLYSPFIFGGLDVTDRKFNRIKEKDVLKIHTITLVAVTKTFDEVFIQSKGKHPKHKTKNDSEPQKLYWDKNYGIIKYETYGGEVWERINW